MADPLETYLAVEHGAFAARLVNGALVSLEWPPMEAQDPQALEQRLAALLRRALARHMDDLLDASGATDGLEPWLVEAVAEQRLLVEQARDHSPSLDREIVAACSEDAQEVVGENADGSVRVRLVDGMVTAIELDARSATSPGRAVTAKVDEALQRALEAVQASGPDDMDTLLAGVTPETLGSETAALRERLARVGGTR